MLLPRYVSWIQLHFPPCYMQLASQQFILYFYRSGKCVLLDFAEFTFSNRMSKATKEPPCRHINHVPKLGVEWVVTTIIYREKQWNGLFDRLINKWVLQIYTKRMSLTQNVCWSFVFFFNLIPINNKKIYLKDLAKKVSICNTFDVKI